MTNANKFKEIFGLYATELWVMPEADFLKWLNADYKTKPSADRPQGKWIMHVDDLFPCESTQECSICHAEQLINGNDDNFCPNCGADMRSEQIKPQTCNNCNLERCETCVIEIGKTESQLMTKCLNCANGGSYKCSKCDGEMYFKDRPQIERSE